MSSSNQVPSFVVTNIGQLLSNAPLRTLQLSRERSISVEDLGLLQDAWLWIEEGKVKSFGPMASGIPATARSQPNIDARGCLVTPGLIDCHTHPIFGGDRSNEFKMRLDGESYQSIAAEGGGIQSTIKATRQATDDELASGLMQHLSDFLDQGITSIEVKSGYGQTVEEELRHLRIVSSLRSSIPQTLAVTYLGLHANGGEHSSVEAMVEAMSSDAVFDAIKKEALAEWCDAFVEAGYFPPSVAEPYFKKAKAAGLKIRIHADEFADSGAAAAAARWGARSADHLECVNQRAIEHMAASDCVAVLLPGTSLYSRLPYTQAKALREAGCRIAVATDFNPGSCYLKNLVFMAAIAGIHGGLTAAEVVAAITYNAAYSLELENTKGHLDEGADADFIIHPFTNLWAWLSDCGQRKPKAVYIAGKKQR